MLWKKTPILPKHWTDFLSSFKFIIYGETVFERKIDFLSPYVHIFHAQTLGKLSDLMMLIGLEDRDEGMIPDGWTDILLPIFYNEKWPEANACKTSEGVFYVDMALSGAYRKEVFFFSQNQWRKLYRSSVQEGGMFLGDSSVKISCGYIEYCPKLDRLCNFDFV